MSLGAIYVASGPLDFLFSSVQSVLPCVDSLLIGLDCEFSGQNDPLGAIRNLLEREPKIQLVQEPWANEQGCLEALARILLNQGKSHVLIVDPQQVYSKRDLSAILDYVRNHQNVGQFQLKQYQYWKGLSYRIEPPDSETVTVISRITPTTRFSAQGRTNEQPLILIPSEVGMCHSFTFASPDHHVRRRLSCSGLSSQAIEHWKNQVWNQWNNNRSLRSLHPQQPERFRSAVPVNAASLPEVLAEHPYLKYEIAEDETKRKPIFSLFIQANSGLATLEQFIENLIKSNFPDWELIVRVSSDCEDILSFLRSKPGVKMVLSSGALSGFGSLSEWVQVATGHYYLFLRDCLQFEGDWMEGFLAAFEESPSTIFLPVITDAPLENDSLSNRRLLFEQRRGRFYGQKTSITTLLSWAELPCWACSREQWPQWIKNQGLLSAPVLANKDKLLASGNSHTQTSSGIGNCQAKECFSEVIPVPAECQILEDTLLFSPTGSNQQGIGIPKPVIPAEYPVRGDLVSIVIPVFNNLHFTKACLESIFSASTPGTYEVIVVDNGSTDDTESYLRKLKPQIRYIRNHRNLFFAGGCNRGAWAAQGENLLFLNNDVVVKPGWLDEMLNVLSADPKIGIVGNKQLFPSSDPVYPNRVWHAGVIMTPDVAPLQIYYGFDPTHPLVNVQRDYPAVIGSCFLIRKKLFEQLKGFDNWYRNGHEETDLCLRAGELGYRVVYTPKSEIIHYVSQTESRFDREIENLLKFRQRWANRIVPTEPGCYHEAGLLPAANARAPIRVGFVSPFNQENDVATYAKQLLNEFPKESYVVLAESGIHDQCPGSDPPEVLRGWNRNCDWYYPLLRWTHSMDVDIVHINFDPGLFPRGLTGYVQDLKRAGKKTVVTFHQTSPLSRQSQELWEIADAVVVQSSQNRLELMAQGCHRSKIHVIAPGIPLISPVPLQIARESSGIPLSQKVIVSHGLIQASMGNWGVIQAVAELRKKMDVLLLVLRMPNTFQGDGLKVLEECKLTVKQLGLDRHVLFFHEFLCDDELIRYLSSADAIVVSESRNEQVWSGTLAFGVATGRPIIAYPASAVPHLQDAVFRTPEGSSLTLAIDSVLTNPFLSRCLGNKALQFAAEHSWKQSAGLHWALYKQLMEEKSPVLVGLAEYQALSTRNYSTEMVEKLYSELKAGANGKLIEFGCRSLDLTEYLRPEVSVTHHPELCSVASSLGLKTLLLSVKDFVDSDFARNIFDTILLHIRKDKDPCSSLVLSFLPHLSEKQQLLIVLDTNEFSTSDIEKRIMERIPPHLKLVQADLGIHLNLLKITCKSKDAGVDFPSDHFGPGQTDSLSESGRKHCLVPVAITPLSIYWSGHFYEQGDYGESARTLVLALSANDLPLKIGDCTNHPIPLDGKRALRLNGLQHATLTRRFIHVDQRHPHQWNKEANSLWNVVRLPSEIESLNPSHISRLNAMDAVWVPSRFHFEVCAHSGLPEDKLFILPDTLDFSLFTQKKPSSPLKGSRSFSFLSVIEVDRRSGWELLLRAFLSEFKQDEDVTLILALDRLSEVSLQKATEQISSFIRTRMNLDPAQVQNVLVQRRNAESDKLMLYRASQAFIQPVPSGSGNRALLTAMACALPVIAVPYGMNAELINDQNAYPVTIDPSGFTSISRREFPDSTNSPSGAPSVIHLGELMRHILTHSPEAKQKAALACKDVYSNFSWERIVTLMKSQLQEICEKTRPQARFRLDLQQLKGTPEIACPHVCWEGPQLVNHSLALVNRELESSLIESRQVELSIVPVGEDTFARSLVSKSKTIVNHYGKDCGRPVDVHVRHQWPPNWTPPSEGHFVVIQPWEYGSLPVEWVRSINESVDELWVPSCYVRQLYIESGVTPNRVHVVPNGVDAELFRPGLRPLKLPHVNFFKFLFLGGTIHRKGIDLLLQAFQKAFTSTDDVLLVIKDMGTRDIYQGQGLGEQIRQLQKSPQAPRIYYLDQDLTDEEIARLYNACHCLVHPYRGEGFGLPVLEAMSCAMPVIVTAGGATDDFVDEASGYRIPAHRQGFGNREISGLKTTGDLWMLEPDVDELAKLLSYVFTHRSEAAELGQAAREKVVRQWTWRHAASRVLTRIDSIRRKPIRRFQEKVDNVVLIDIRQPGFSSLQLDLMLDSLRTNSYSKIKVFLRDDESQPNDENSFRAHPGLEVVSGRDYGSILRQISRQVRAPFFTVISEPLLFSKQWVAQLSAIADQIGDGRNVLAPSLNLKESPHYVPYDGGDDEFSFQKFARTLWRNRRGQHQELLSLPMGCFVTSWQCLEQDGDWPSCQDWLQYLRESGAKVYWAQDTFLRTMSKVPEDLSAVLPYLGHGSVNYLDQQQ
jgi:glycosyltransferase involved in cell wall biosynthesis